jgi:type I restriction enzyme R subunit
MDWDNPTHNDFLLCSQFWITGDMHTRRADLVGFVNGLPLVLFELNAGSLNADEFFQQLMTFAKSLSEEEKRGVSKQLNEEELALFDLLTKPQIELSDSDREKVKVTARDLLNTLKAGKLVLDWRKRQQARADVRITIEKMLDMGLPRAYTPELFDQKTSAVFQHVYDAYYGAGHSVYPMA